MQIIADRHHADLYWSLQLLADRLGAKLFTPYGLNWYDKQFYDIYGDLRKKKPYQYLAKKYLEDTIFTEDRVIGDSQERYYGCQDYPALNLLTLEQAKNTQIDIVICTLHENEEAFARLKEFWPNAKFIRQTGNDLDTLVNNTLYPNLLSSAVAPYNAFNGHKILYKQEFSQDLFKYIEPISFNNIYSFQNNLEAFEETWELWTRLKHQLRDYKFRSYGNENENGKIYPKRELIKAMLETTFSFQSKNKFEGYGHVIFNLFCLGRPIILRYSEYQDKIAAPLLIKDETYLEMDDPDLVEKIRYFSEPPRFKKMSEKCIQTFKSVVDFDKEWEEKLKPFFNNLV